MIIVVNYCVFDGVVIMSEPGPKNNPASSPDEMIQPGITSTTELSDKELEDVSAGVGKFVKIDGIKGESQDDHYKDSMP